MTTSVNNNGALPTISSLPDISAGGSIQFQFAKLQLVMSQQAKAQAENYMKEIENIQKEQSEVARMIELARATQNELPKDDKKKANAMPDEMIKFMEDRDISFDLTGDYKTHNREEWDYNIQSLQNYQESISNKTQTLMVYLQDFIGQYNSYLQGASSTISQANQVLTTVATGR